MNWLNFVVCEKMKTMKFKRIKTFDTKLTSQASLNTHFVVFVVLFPLVNFQLRRLLTSIEVWGKQSSLLELRISHGSLRLNRWISVDRPSRKSHVRQDYFSFLYHSKSCWQRSVIQRSLSQWNYCWNCCQTTFSWAVWDSRMEIEI